jgi:hypothetical protein
MVLFGHESGGVEVMTRLRFLLFFLLGGLVLAIHLSHLAMPTRQPIERVVLHSGWIGSDYDSRRCYFRVELDVPFVPDQAWLAFAADDYELYINGRMAGKNLHLTDSGLAFQNKISEKTQSLTHSQVVAIPRGPTHRIQANEDWRVVQMFDVREAIRPGRNVLAIFVQSHRVEEVRFAIEGEVRKGELSIPIPNLPEAWKMHSVSTIENGLRWYEPDYDDSHWRPATSGNIHTGFMYAPFDLDVWRTKFNPKQILAPEIPTGAVFERDMPKFSHGSTGWFRITASVPYELFIGSSWVASGDGKEQIDALDITQYLPHNPEVIRVHLHRSVSGKTDSALLWFAIDGKIGSETLDLNLGWRCAVLPGEDKSSLLWSPAVAQNLSVMDFPVRLNPIRVPDRFWYRDLVGTSLFLSLLLSILARMLGLLTPLPTSFRFRNTLGIGCCLLTPALLAILMLELLRLRLQESDTMLVYLDPEVSPWLFLTGPIVLGMTLVASVLAYFVSPLISASYSLLTRAPVTYLLLLACIVLGSLLRWHMLDFQELQADENVSWDAARGIMKTGAPLAVSGVYYTRSPLYHYLLAGWLMLCGDHLITARAFSLIPGILVIPATYWMMREITGRRSLALLAATVIAFDPWQINVCGIIRFYQQMQLFSVLALTLFWRGFMRRDGRIWQNLFFACCTAGVLSQEVFVTSLPAFTLAFVVAYRPWNWKHDLNILVGFVTMMAITAIDIGIFTITCLTPHVGVGTSSGSIMQLNFNNVSAFATTFFWMANGNNSLFSIIFFCGLIYWMRRNHLGVWLLYAQILLTIVTLTVLVLQVASRYCYGIYPFMVGIVVITVDEFIRRFGQTCRHWMQDRSKYVVRTLQFLVVCLFLLAEVINMEPLRMYDSYDRTRFLEHQSALVYIDSARLPEDVVISVHPMPAAIISEGIEYYAMGFLSFDEVYQADNFIVDRWGGGKLVSKLDQFQALFQRHDRVWVVVDEFEFPKMAPGVSDFLMQVCTVEREFLGGMVLLWDKSQGRWTKVPNKGGEADSW